MPLSLHQIFASVWSGWLATWPTQLVALIWIGWLVSWTLGSFWSARTEKRPVTWRARAHRLPVIVGGLLLTPWTAQALGERPLWNAGNAVTYALALVVLAGVLFTWWARIHLGRFWSNEITRKEGHRVIDTGPYALVRHPIYTGWFLMVFAASPMTMTRLVFAVVSCAYLIVAIPFEERSMVNAAAGAYERYRKQVPWRLVPRIY